MRSLSPPASRRAPSSDTSRPRHTSCWPTSAASPTGSFVPWRRGHADEGPVTALREAFLATAADACRGPGTDVLVGTSAVERQRGDRRRRRLRGRPADELVAIVAERAALDPAFDLRPAVLVAAMAGAAQAAFRAWVESGGTNELTTMVSDALQLVTDGLAQLDHGSTAASPATRSTRRRRERSSPSCSTSPARSPSSPVAVAASARRSSGATPTPVPTSSSPAASSTTARRSPSRSSETTGRKALPVACHVGRWDDCDRLIDTVYEQFGRCDIFVNNAGMSPLYPDLTSITEEYYDKVQRREPEGTVPPRHPRRQPHGGGRRRLDHQRQHDRSLRPGPTSSSTPAPRPGSTRSRSAWPRRSGRRSGSTASFPARS